MQNQREIRAQRKRRGVGTLSEISFEPEKAAIKAGYAKCEKEGGIGPNGWRGKGGPIRKWGCCSSKNGDIEDAKSLMPMLKKSTGKKETS